MAAMRCQPGRLAAEIAHAVLIASGLALAGCGARGDGTGGGGEAGAELGNFSGGINSTERARLEARAEATLRRALAEAPTRLENVRSGVNGAICGEVDTFPGATGPVGLRPFLVTRGGEAFVSSGPGLRLENPADPFPDLYMQWCATPQELQSIRQRLQEMRPADVQVARPPGAVPNMPPVAIDETPGEPPPPAPPSPPPPRATRPPGDDSFFNAVVHSPRAE
jgi:hypothetical protein